MAGITVTEANMGNLIVGHCKYTTGGRIYATAGDLVYVGNTLPAGTLLKRGVIGEGVSSDLKFAPWLRGDSSPPIAVLDVTTTVDNSDPFFADYADCSPIIGGLVRRDRLSIWAGQGVTPGIPTTSELEMLRSIRVIGANVIDLGVIKQLSDPTKEVAELLLSGQNVNLWTIGISRTAQAFPQYMVNFCQPIPWAGALEHQTGTNAGVGAGSPWTYTIGTPMSGDLDGTLIAGYEQSDVSVFRINAGVTFSAGTVAATYNADAMYYWVGFDGTYRNLLERNFARNQGQPIKSVHFFRALATGQDNVRGFMQVGASRTYGNTVNVTGTDYAVSVASMALPALANVTAAGFTVGAAVVPGSTTTVGSIGGVFGAEKCGTGVFVGSCSVGGRTILGWLDDTLWNPATHGELYTRLATEFDAETVFWIEVGANPAPDVTDENYVTRMAELIAKCRAMVPGCKIMMSDGYATSSDTPGVDPYYVRLEPSIAAAHGCGWFPTYHAMPNYADGNAAGYYVDVSHYSGYGYSKVTAELGRQMLIAAKKPEAAIPDPGALHCGVIATQGIDNANAVSEWRAYAGARKGDVIFKQATASARPPVVDGVVQFVAAEGNWLQDVFLWSSVQARNFYTLAFAFDFPVPAGTSYLISSGGAATTIAPNVYSGSGTETLWCKASAANTDQFIGSLNLTGKHILVVQRTYQGRFQAWIDGVSVFNQTLTNTGETTAAVRGSLGSSDGANPATGDIFGCWAWTSGEVDPASIRAYIQGLGWA